MTGTPNEEGEGIMSQTTTELKNGYKKSLDLMRKVLVKGS
jgi:hypothetical protein